MKVKSLCSYALNVEIINVRTQEKTQINLQPRAGVTLPEGYIVDPNFKVRNKTNIRIVE